MVNSIASLHRVCGKKFFVGVGCGVWGVGCGVWGVGFYPFSCGQLPNFQGKSPGIFPPITPMVGTF
ncbi:unknown protein [Microcystis aeruginosa NIES-843]|uniref:Uncharacterized protein n=1 Tax=Microcystis aeruginosa (strain NIES-843 / IAM M-2473) TaxID=449447 RepID=B0JJA6_MICAN|nr:unknown protein [Microcystis aeruginosa NIES-843]